MERRRQTFDEIISNLSRIESDWKDDHAKSVMDLLDRTEERGSIKPAIFRDSWKRTLKPA